MKEVDIYFVWRSGKVNIHHCADLGQSNQNESTINGENRPGYWTICKTPAIYWNYLGQYIAKSSPTWSNQNACWLNGKIFNLLIFIFVLKNQVHLKTYSNGHIAGFRRPGGGGGRALGYFLVGYVPPRSPNWHPVPKNISPVTAPGSSYKSCDHNSGYEGKCFDHQKGWNRLNTAEVLLQMPLSEIKRKTCWN